MAKSIRMFSNCKESFSSINCKNPVASCQMFLCFGEKSLANWSHKERVIPAQPSPQHVSFLWSLFRKVLNVHKWGVRWDRKLFHFDSFLVFLNHLHCSRRFLCEFELGCLRVGKFENISSFLQSEIE